METDRKYPKVSSTKRKVKIVRESGGVVMTLIVKRKIIVELWRQKRMVKRKHKVYPILVV